MQRIVELFVTSPDKFLVLGSISLAVLLFVGILLSVYYGNVKMVKILSLLSIAAMISALAMGDFLPFPEEELVQLRRRNFELDLELHASNRSFDELRNELLLPIAHADSQIAAIDSFLNDTERLINREVYQEFTDTGFFDDYQLSVREGFESFSSLRDEWVASRGQLVAIGGFPMLGPDPVSDDQLPTAEDDGSELEEEGASAPADIAVPDDSGSKKGSPE
jgi:hypothetical protein